MNPQPKPIQSGSTPIIPTIGRNPRAGTNPNQSQNFIAQSRARSNPSKPGSVKPLTDDFDQLCRSKFSVFGQITSPVLFAIILLILAVLVILFVVYYYKAKVKLDNSTLISKPIPLNTPYRIPNSDTSPKMSNANEFSYQFWLYIDPPTTNSTSNALVFIRDSDTYPPRFCVYFSDNGSTLNVASLLNSDVSKIPCDQKQFIDNLQFDLLPNFYLVSSTRQISFYRWFLVSIVGQSNKLVLYVNSVPYNTEINDENLPLLNHSGSIDIAFKPKYNTYANSYISKLKVYNYPINQTLMEYAQKYGPQ